MISPKTTNLGLDGHRAINVKELLEQYDQMSIPHFQRGLVWDTSSVALLLESLYYGTPCGSIILWTPSDVKGQGTQLGPGTPRYLIIDGQQRIRSLHAVFADNDDESATTSSDPGEENDEVEDADASDEGADDKEDGVWCLNLGRLPEFAANITGGKRFRLFRRASDPRRQYLEHKNNKVTGAPLQDREALLPLKWFLESMDQEAAIREHTGQDPGRAIAKAVQAVLTNESVMQRLRQMLTHPAFHVSILRTDDWADVVGVFVRINSAGKRVEAEEKAFANVVAEYKDANSSLEKFFVGVHGDDSRTRPKDFHRDNLLRRQKENRFGFKLFMRAFVIVLAYHSDRKIGSASFSFESANAETLAKAGPHLPTILDATVTLLEHVAATLRETPLFCDDLRMLPETASLWPLFQLLTRFPGLMPKGKDTLASIALRLMLADLPKGELLKLSGRVSDAQTVKGALDLFNSPPLSTKAIKQKIQKGVQAQSLTNRYTLVLYWLLRRQGARDFLYAQNAPECAARLRAKYETVEEPELCERLAPQKQHIVPYAHLKDLFDLVGARPGRHEVHDIGNLTYISAGQNSWTCVGSKPLKVSAEPPSNQDAHMLLDPTLLADYQSAISASPKSAKASYQKFCARRREVIVQRLLDWEQERRDAGRVPVEDLVPAARLIRPVPPDIIRSLGYPASVTAHLVELCGRNGVSVVTRKDDRLSIVSKQKTAGRNSRQLLRVDLDRSGKKLGLKLSADEFLADFRSRFPGVPLDNRKGKHQGRARASFVDNKKNRLLVDCRNNSDGSYTVKVIHKTVLPEGGKSTRQGMISHFKTWDEARAKFDENVPRWTPKSHH